MEHQDFDDLSRMVATAGSGRAAPPTNRRLVLGALLLGVSGVFGLTERGAAKPLKNGRLRRHRKRQRRRRANNAGTAPTCADAMRSANCVWALGGGGARWDCPRRINATNWDLSSCDGRAPQATLQGADLPEAQMDGANLIRANMSYSNLVGAKLTETNLTWANVRYADLAGVDFSGSRLDCADLTGATNFNPWGTARECTIMPNGVREPSRSPLPQFGCDSFCPFL